VRWHGTMCMTWATKGYHDIPLSMFDMKRHINPFRGHMPASQQRRNLLPTTPRLTCRCGRGRRGRGVCVWRVGCAVRGGAWQGAPPERAPAARGWRACARARRAAAA